MFSSIKLKILLIIYIIIVLSIPAGTYLLSQQQNVKGRAEEPKSTAPATPIIPPSPSPAPASNLLEDLLKATPAPTSPTIASSFGPTLYFKIAIEGRPVGNQAGEIYVGIMEGELASNPKFLLSFLVEVPESGEYGNLSIAGLSPGSRYTALLKGNGQIATSSAFIMSPTESKLNDGQVLNLTSGDLNEDNIINAADYSIAQAALFATPSSPKWNENADFNKDGIINSLDIAIIAKNMGKIGASGIWISPLPQATPSGSLQNGSPGGHWIWIPEI